MPGPQPPPDAPDAFGSPGAIDRWLAAERSGLDDAAAEAAFAELLAGLPRPAPPAGFAERVLARARRPATRRSWLGWRRAAPGLRGVIAAAAAAAAAALLALLLQPVPSGVAAAMAARFGATSIAGLLQVGVGAAIAAGRWLAGVVAFGNQLLLLVRAVAEPLATAPVAALAAASLLVSVLAMRCLYDLIQRDRRWVYVDPI
jgi:hypothetical protein